MDKKPAGGRRVEFRWIFTSGVPKRLVGNDSRHALVIVNEGTDAIRVGASGTVATTGTYIPGTQSLSDNYSSDEYWGYVASGSGTVSGFMVV